MTGKEFRRRVEEQYQRHTGNEGEHGAQTWFGKYVGRPSKRVWAWMDAKKVPTGPHLRMLTIAELMPAGTWWLKDPLKLGGKR